MEFLTPQAELTAVINSGKMEYTVAVFANEEKAAKFNDERNTKLEVQGDEFGYIYDTTLPLIGIDIAEITNKTELLVVCLTGELYQPIAVCKDRATAETYVKQQNETLADWVSEPEFHYVSETLATLYH